MASAKLIGERVQARRSALSLSRRALARRAGVSKSTVSRVESGTCAPHEETLLSLARALETPFSELVRVVQPRIRTRVVVAKPEPVVTKKAEPEEEAIPMVVAKLLCTGRLGKVSSRELRQLIRNSRKSEFAGDAGLLELTLLFRRACAAMHDREAKQKFDEAFERIRRDMERE